MSTNFKGKDPKPKVYVTHNLTKTKFYPNLAENFEAKMSKLGHFIN